MVGKDADDNLQKLRELVEQQIIPDMVQDGGRVLICYGETGLFHYQIEILYTESENMQRKAS